MPKLSQKHQIKILLPSEEHDRVRLAAALRRMAMAEFCREAVVVEAGQATKGLALPQADKVESRKSR